MTYREYLTGKRVVVVGPAPTVIGSEQHDFVESYDVVVRLNHSLPVPEDLKADVGDRTDVLYHNLWNNHPQGLTFAELIPILEETVDWVCGAHPDRNLDYHFADDIAVFKKELNGRVPFYSVDPEVYCKATEEIGCRLNVGVSAIIDLLHHPILELYMTGFTFYDPRLPEYDPYYKGLGLAPRLHKQENQKKYLRAVYRRDDRLRCDRFLQRVFEGTL